MEHLTLYRREYVRGTRDYHMTITEEDLKTINDALVKNGSTFAQITYEDIKEIWEPTRDENERDNQKLHLQTWDGKDYEESVTDFVREYLQDWIYECDYDEDTEYDDWAPEDWSEEY